MIRYACLFDKKDGRFAAYHSEWRKVMPGLYDDVNLEQQTLVDFDDSKLVNIRKGSESDT